MGVSWLVDNSDTRACRVVLHQMTKIPGCEPGGEVSSMLVRIAFDVILDNYHKYRNVPIASVATEEIAGC